MGCGASSVFPSEMLDGGGGNVPLGYYRNSKVTVHVYTYNDEIPFVINLFYNFPTDGK